MAMARYTDPIKPGKIALPYFDRYYQAMGSQNH